MSAPLVTVICPTYNRAALLRCALRSVLNQDFADYEVRIMGDGCTDESEQVVAGFNDDRLHWFNLPENTGNQTAPNNEGLRLARGRYVAFIGHDDLWLPWHLSRLVKHLQETGSDVVHDLAASIGPDGIEGVYGPPHERIGYQAVYFPTSSWLHTRELAQELGGWRQPTELAWAIDYDFTRRAAEAGKRLSFLPSLGVLKFHSQRWKAYAHNGEPPEQRWLEAILQSPALVNEEVLTGVAALCAYQFQAGDKKPFDLAWEETYASIKVTTRASLRALLSWYGLDRWPVGHLLRQRMQRRRARERKLRGLPPD